jgi:hypothetical protein
MHKATDGQIYSHAAVPLSQAELGSIFIVIVSDCLKSRFETKLLSQLSYYPPILYGVSHYNCLVLGICSQLPSLSIKSALLKHNTPNERLVCTFKSDIRLIRTIWLKDLNRHNSTTASLEDEYQVGRMTRNRTFQRNHKEFDEQTYITTLVMKALRDMRYSDITKKNLHNTCY